MTDEILRLGVDTRGVDEGSRRASRSYGDISKSARDASDQNERLERVMRETGEQSARAAQAMEQSARANRAVGEATRRAAQDQDVYARAVRERVQTEREVSRMASGRSTVDAQAAAESYIRAQESYYRTNMARVRLAAAQGLITPEEAAQKGQEAAQAYNTAVSGVLQRRPAFRENREAFTALAGSLKDVGESGRRGSLGMSRLNFTLASLARQATGAHPAIGQLANVVSTFAVGSAATVGVLAGIAAIGVAWQRLTRDAREAKEEQKELMDVLDRLAERQRLEGLGPGGQAVPARAAGLSEIQRTSSALASQRAALDRLIQERDRGRGFEAEGAASEIPAVQRSIAALEEQYELAIDRVQAGEREIARARAEAEEEAQRERDRITDQIREGEAERARIRREGVELKVRLLKIESDAEARRAQQRRDDHEERLRLLQIEKDAEAERANERRRDFALRRSVEAAVERNAEEEARAEAAAIQAQEQALQKLVQALQNVGRAYGGVTDQILALTAASLSLDRMPMDTQRNRLTAYGTAAATGVGVGASTGSPALGAIGGAAAGFSLAGPYGAIVGGVAGIVSGLFEQGRRARQAAEEWDNAMERWETAYRDRTPVQQRMDQLEQEYRAAVRQAQGATGISGSIPDPEGVAEFAEYLRQIPKDSFRDYADMLERAADLYEQNAEAIREWQREQETAFAEDLRVRLLRAQGMEEEAAALDMQLRHERELQQAREMGFSQETLALLEQAQAEEALAAAREEQLDAVNDITRALNSPSGLNLALYRWRASMNIEPSMDTSRPPRGGRTRGTGTVTDGDRRGGAVTYNFHERAIVVEATDDPEATAEEVLRAVRRQALRGGGDPYETVNR